MFSAEGALIGNSEADRQLLEASKSGDVETVKVVLTQSLVATLEEWSVHTVYTGIFCLALQKLCTAHNVNCRDVVGRQSTPLHFAAGYNRLAVVQFLLQHGADVHAKDKG